MDFSRLRQGEIVAGLAGIALIVCMFLPWYGLGLEVPEIEIPEGLDPGAIPETPEVDDDASGWDALTDFDGFLIALAGVAGIALAGLAAARRRVNLGGLPRGAGTAFLAVLAVALIVWRIFAQPTPGAHLEVGIFLALASAIALAVGAIMALREGGFEPIATVAGGRTRAASSPATATTGRASTSQSSSGARSGGRSGSRSSSAKSRGSSSRSRSGSGRKKS